MKKFRAGLAALIVACITALALVVAAQPAQAWDVTDSSKPPPRIAPPVGTTAPKVTTPLTKPMIPPGIMGSALKVLGTAGLGYMIGSTYRALSCAGGVTPLGSFQPCTDAEKSLWDSKVASDPLPVDPLPDKVWCVYNGGCKDTAAEMPPVVAPVDPPPNNYGQYKWSVTQLVGTSDIRMTRAYTKGNYCNSNPTWGSCDPNWQESSSSVKFRGSCRASNGLGYGLMNVAYTKNQFLGSSTVGAAGPTRTPGNICPNTTVLEWLIWADDTGFMEGSNGFWVNPNVDSWKTSTITTNLTCKNSAGATVTVSKTAPAGTGLAPVVSCPAGYVPDSGNTMLGNDFLTAPTKTEEWSITPAVREAYPDCIGWQSAGCKLMIQLDGVECNPGNPACLNWEEIWRVQPSRVKCKWGPYDMDISHCLPLRNAYIGENGTVTDPKRSPKAAPVAVDPFGRPLDDKLQNPDPEVPTATTPETGSNPLPPTVGIPPVTGTPPVTTYTPPEVQTGDANCWPGGSAAFNPLEWVLMPVKCALQWAFVPRQATAEAQMTRIQNNLGKVGVVGAIGTVTTSINTVGAAAGNGSGCTGPTFHFDFDAVHQELQPFNACAEPVATMAAVSNAFTTVVVIVMGLLGVVRALGSSVGFNFTMGKGGGS